MEKEFYERLFLSKKIVKLTSKDGKFYKGKVAGVSSFGILFIDKFNNEMFFDFDNISKIIPTRENGNGGYHD